MTEAADSETRSGDDEGSLPQRLPGAIRGEEENEEDGRSMIRAEVVGWRRRYEEACEYVVYEVNVHAGKLAWRIARRYTEFRVLDERLRRLGIELQLPKARTGAAVRYSLVTKLLGRRYAESGREVAGRREEALGQYVKELIGLLEGENPPALEALVLEFFGAATKSYANRNRERTLQVRVLPSYARAGDIILFRSKETVSSLQRCLTGSRWDHVALVVESHQKAKLLLEATCDGVALVSLVPRLRAYGAAEIAYRRLEVLDSSYEFTRKQITHHLWRFAAAVDGAQYKFGFDALLEGLSPRWNLVTETSPSKSTTQINHSKKKSKLRSVSSPPAFETQPPPPPLNTPPPSRKKQTTLCCGQSQSTYSQSREALSDDDDNADSRRTFFCSQLVARALQSAGIIRNDISADAFWPGTFSTQAKTRFDSLLLPPSAYGPEILVDTAFIELAHSSSARFRGSDCSCDRSSTGSTFTERASSTSPIPFTPRSAHSIKRLARRGSTPPPPSLSSPPRAPADAGGRSRHSVILPRRGVISSTSSPPLQVENEATQSSALINTAPLSQEQAS